MNLQEIKTKLNEIREKLNNKQIAICLIANTLDIKSSYIYDFMKKEKIPNNILIKLCLYLNYSENEIKDLINSILNIKINIKYEIRNNISILLQKYNLHNNITITELAGKLGISRQYISNIILCKNNLTYIKFDNIACELNLKKDYIEEVEKITNLYKEYNILIN
jgi:plasmid maintenance system antidote protein VapI/predicted DNA-binding transcriptional regulator AlpA